MRVDSTCLRHVAYVLLVVAMALGGCASVATPPTPTLQERLEAAHSRADHQALEAYFNAEAAQAHAKAQEHRNMILTYLNQVATGRANANMPTHCHMLIEAYENMAAHYELMAASHHQLAAEADS